MTTINIYYGGRGLIDDPSIYVMDKLTTVFDELNVNVKRYNLYEDKHGISVHSKILKGSDAVIITASVEWFWYWRSFCSSFLCLAGFTETRMHT